MIDTNTNPLPDMTNALKEVKGYSKGGKVKDYDGDGKIESGSKEHAGSVHNAIQRKKGLKPDGKDTRKEEVAVKESMLLTKADKKGNTPAWQNRDKKNVKTGEPLYKKADHLKKEEVEIETLKKMELFSDDEIQAIVDKMDFSGEE